ncbi:MAG: class I SAM-dependent methyltransferase [Chloroflexi bacterium]|nr:class I SAM-dependent methyltransferase [Chloroflexota bacterium]
MEPVWRRYLHDYNEGLGVVYERLVLNDYLLSLKAKYGVETVLEAPLYGMAGVSGINSVALARAGCAVTLLDEDAERLEGVKRIWHELNLDGQVNILRQTDFGSLPFDDGRFDLAWCWAALWYVRDAERLLAEMARVSRWLVFVAMPNRIQVGYLLRKFVLEPGFFKGVDESWADIRRVTSVLTRLGLKAADEGVMDVPPWPDTVMPAGQVLQRLGVRSKRIAGRFEGSGWQWSTMDYYLGRRPELKAMIERYMFLERLPLPRRLKTLWAHHCYVLARKPYAAESPSAGG